MAAVDKHSGMLELCVQKYFYSSEWSTVISYKMHGKRVTEVNVSFRQFCENKNSDHLRLKISDWDEVAHRGVLLEKIKIISFVSVSVFYYMLSNFMRPFSP